MRPRSIAASAATLIAAASLSPLAAHADSSTTLYVNNASTTCSDSGSGTTAAPFCTIQAAADAAVAGDTVSVAAGTYAPTTVTTSGTAAEPITFTGPASGATAKTSFTLSGASNVAVEDFELTPEAGSGLVVDGGSNISVVSVHADTANSGSGGTSVHVTGAASAVTVRDSFLNSPVLVDDGATGTIVTTNVFTGFGVSAVGAVNTAITSNTLQQVCGTGISVTGSSSGTSIENNIVAQYWASDVTGCPAQAYGILVDASSVGTTKSDYNDVPDLAAGTAAYDWNGATYTTPAAFNTGTGQGAHDLADTLLEEGSPIINSADSGAIGEQAVDVDGAPRVNDPLVAHTGTGPYGDYDRGAYQFQDPFTAVTESVSIPSQAPVGTPIPVSAHLTDTWSDTISSYRFIAKDGTVLAQSATGSATVEFPTTGPNDIAVWATASNGDSGRLATESISLVPAAPLVVSNVLTQDGNRGVELKDTSTDPWLLTRVAVHFGDGTDEVIGSGSTVTHTYAEGGVYTISEIVTDADGQTATVNKQFATAKHGPGSLLLSDVPATGHVFSGSFGTALATSGIAQSAIAELSGGSAQVVAVTTGGKVEFAIRGTNGVWQSLQALGEPSGVTVKSVSIAAMPNGSTQFVEVTSTGLMLHNIRNANGTWQGWAEPTGSTGITQASIAALPNGSSQMVAVTTAGVLMHDIRNADGSWQGWHALSQPGVKVTDAAIAGFSDGSSQIVEVTSTGALKHDIREANGSWQATGWGTLLSSGAAQASITALAGGGSFVAYVSVGGIFWDNLRNENGSWGGWGQGANSTTDIGGFADIDVATLPGTASVQAVAVNTNG